MSYDIQTNILNVFVEFLREVNFDFQILMINTKLNTDEYMESYTKDIEDIGNNYNASKYFEELKKSIEESSIYITKYYLVVTYSGNIENIDRIVNKLNKAGCKVARLKDIKEIKNILYKTFNKMY